MTRFSLITLLMALMSLGAGCSNSDDGPTNSNNGPAGTASTTWDAENGYWITSLDASSYDDFVYYSFDTKDKVTLSEAEAVQSTAWDIAFKRSVIITNGGDSGPGSVAGVNLSEKSVNKDLSELTESDLSGLSAGDWTSDGKDLVLDNYYQYNPQTHQLTMTKIVYALLDAEGKYAKFRISNLIGGGAPPAMGNFVIDYVYGGDDPDLSGPVETDTVDGSSGEFYYDFSAGTSEMPADPSSSTAWDIKVSSYDVFLNSSFSGPGQAAANPASWLVDMADSTDLSEYNSAITVPQAYSQDIQGSVFTNWYDYDGQTHTLTSKGDLFAIDVDGKKFALEIVTWYGKTGVSGNFIINWKQID